jgi:hypothetical protein
MHVRCKKINGKAALRMLLVFMMLIPAAGRVCGQAKVILDTPARDSLHVCDVWNVLLVNRSADTMAVFVHASIAEAAEGLIYQGRSDTLFIPPMSDLKTDICRGNPMRLNDYAFPGLQNGDNLYLVFPSGIFTLCVSISRACAHEELDRECIKVHAATTAAADDSR